MFSSLAEYQEKRKKYFNNPPPSTSDISEFVKQKILNSDVTTLIDMLNDNEVYYERAATIGLKLEAIAESNIEEALILAAQCDEMRQSLSGNKEKLNKLPPLYGIPISIKSNVNFKGKSINLGCVNYLDHIPTEDGFILKLLRNSGAIPFITSNIPQVLMSNESVNRIWGRAKNPWDIKRTSGGSSGGESALISARCSPIGLGSDIGGSIRVPCLYTGIYGIKVTSNRLTFEGIYCANTSGKRGNINIKACVGPMGKSVQDLALMLKSCFIKEMWIEDKNIVPLPWNEEEYTSKRKLRVGYIENDNYFTVSPGNRRAVLETVKVLESKGHEVIKTSFPNFEKGVHNFFSILTAAGKFRPFTDMIGIESPIDEYKQLNMMANLPNCLRDIIAYVLKLTGEKRKMKLVKNSSEKTAWEYLNLSLIQQELKEEFHKWWKNNKFDVIISPGLAIPSITHGSSVILNLSCCYTFYFNLLDYPTGVVPITKVKENEQTYIDPINNDSYVKLSKENMKGTKGLPLGVQITTLPYEEELCLNVMKQIEVEIKFHSYPEI